MSIPSELLNRIHEGKWETWMPQIPSNNIDLIITRHFLNRQPDAVLE